MKRTQRKTRVAQEKWARIGDWYWCPSSVIEARILRESPDPIPTPEPRPFGVLYVRMTPKQRQYLVYEKWVRAQRAVYSRIAHHCQDDKIRSIWLEYNTTKKSKRVSILGSCRVCNKTLSRGIRAIIIMELEM